MQPLEFLAAVLPSAGDFYCVAELSSKKKEHFLTKDINELPAKIAEFNARGLNTYVALSAFANGKSRLAANAVKVRSFFLDIDCAEDGPKTYGTKREGMEAFIKFTSDTGLDTLGTPMIIDSGGGYHVYWPLTEDVPIDVWKPVAENFKRLCKQEGIKIDFTVPADAARVLRIPSTNNFKRLNSKGEPRTVTVKVEADRDFLFEDFAQIVRSKLRVAPIEETNLFDLPGVKPTRATTSTILPVTVQNSVTVFKNILVRTESGTGCGQLAHYLGNAADDGMEPLWRGMLSIAQKCVDGVKAAKFLTKLHPYTPERMQQKMNEIKGPYSCVKFDSENPGVCTSCVHFGKITNPLALGREIAVDNEEKVIEAPAKEEGAAPVKYLRPAPPRTYSFGAVKGVFREVEEEDAAGEKRMVRREILAYDMFIIDVLNSNGEHAVHMIALRPEGAVDVIIPQRATVSKDETLKVLASQNILASFGAGNDKHLFDYVRACVGEFSSNKRSTKVPSSYGWQEDGSFVHNNKIYSTSVVRDIPMPGLENLYQVTRPQGDVKQWAEMLKLLAAKGLYDILTLGCVGLGAPMMKFTGLAGMIFHIGSTESGTGKTLALQIAASIWGHPDSFRVGKSTSDVAMLQRAGLLGSQPLISDEITAKNRKDMEWFPAFVFDFSEGRGKERMESGANKERINTTEWNSLGLMSSNTHVVDYMTGARKHSSEGELRRMLEHVPTKVLEWLPNEIDTIISMSSNYGVAGPIYAQWMANNREKCRELVTKTKRHLKAEFNCKDDERFWLAGASAVVAGAIAFGREYANIVDLPIQAIINCLKGMIEKARATMNASVRTAEDVLNSYTREHFGNFVVLSAVTGVGASFGNGQLIDQTTMRSQVAGRVEHGTAEGFTDFFIEEQLLKAYCSSMSFGYADFKRRIESLYRTSYMRKDMMAKTSGPPMRVNVMRISRPDDEADELKEAT